MGGKPRREPVSVGLDPPRLEHTAPKTPQVTDRERPGPARALAKMPARTELVRPRALTKEDAIPMQEDVGGHLVRQSRGGARRRHEFEVHGADHVVEMKLDFNELNEIDVPVQAQRDRQFSAVGGDGEVQRAGLSLRLAEGGRRRPAVGEFDGSGRIDSSEAAAVGVRIPLGVGAVLQGALRSREARDRLRGSRQDELDVPPRQVGIGSPHEGYNPRDHGRRRRRAGRVPVAVAHRGRNDVRILRRGPVEHARGAAHPHVRTRFRILRCLATFVDGADGYHAVEVRPAVKIAIGVVVLIIAGRKDIRDPLAAESLLQPALDCGFPGLGRLVGSPVARMSIAVAGYGYVHHVARHGVGSISILSQSRTPIKVVYNVVRVQLDSGSDAPETEAVVIGGNDSCHRRAVAIAGMVDSCPNVVVVARLVHVLREVFVIDLDTFVHDDNRDAVAVDAGTVGTACCPDLWGLDGCEVPLAAGEGIGKAAARAGLEQGSVVFLEY